MSIKRLACVLIYTSKLYKLVFKAFHRLPYVKAVRSISVKFIYPVLYYQYTAHRKPDILLNK